MTTHLTNQEIYERIFSAISDRRLAPGTKLSEERLAQTFHASRTRIREVLMRLSQELVIELHLNRGAFVASPTPRDLRDVFAVRRALERAIAVQLSSQYSGQSIAVLRSHLKSEEAARKNGDRAALAKLTGDFHLRLAEITENRLFSDNLRRLVALTSLAIAQYDVLATSACPDHEHAGIVAAIESGDSRSAERLMLEHLEHVENGIQPPTEESNEIDFDEVFQV
ncbi:MAG: GntR family transcriptional regulator, partial [Burkholderiales bacterium]|nr:GntR family transcriptional regulator [Burkholderiales bacterium]